MLYPAYNSLCVRSPLLTVGEDKVSDNIKATFVDCETYHSPSRLSSTGKMKRKVAPCPVSLSNQILPP